MKSSILILLILSIYSCAQGAESPAFERNSWIGRGINLGNALDAPTEGSWGVTLQAEYFKIIADAGFNSVRIPVRWTTHMGGSPNYTINKSFFERVDWAINQALSNGLAVVINAHYFDDLNTSQAMKTKLLKVWEQIGERYKNYSDSLFFEIINEPKLDIDGVFLNEVQHAVIEQLRQSNPDRTIIFTVSGQGDLYNLWRATIPQGETNLIATVHYYTPFQFTHQSADWVSGSSAWAGTTWNGTTAEKQVAIDECQMAADWSKENGIPINVGEFGAYEKADLDSRVRWTAHMVQTYESQGFSWAYWEFCANFGAYNKSKKQWRTELLASLMPEPVALSPNIAPVQTGHTIPVSYQSSRLHMYDASGRRIIPGRRSQNPKARWRMYFSNESLQHN